LWSFDYRTLLNNFGHTLRSFHNRFLHCFDGYTCRGCRLEHTKLLTQLIGETVFNSVGMGCYRHAHVLQFANNLEIVAIQFSG